MEEEKVVLEKQAPLWDIVDCRVEIEEISQKAAKMMEADYADLHNISHYWIGIPRATVDLLQELFIHLGRIKEEKKAPVNFSFGRLMDISIEFLNTADADKNGTINPAITVGPELEFDAAKEKYSDLLTVEQSAELEKMHIKYLPQQFYQDREIWEKICVPLRKTLDEKYDIVMTDWSMIILCATYFFRAALQWLVEHKDDSDVGVSITIAELIEFGIRKDGPEDDIEYYTYITPARFFKRECAKSDTITEG